jgi:catechol 2,3-dioxygenase-like lactoylglutathione lyase family enzyme
MRSETKVPNRNSQGVEPLSQWISGIASHVGICVPDLDEALAFYVGLLGFEETWRMTAEGGMLGRMLNNPDAKQTVVQLLVPGGSRIELQAIEPISGEGGKINDPGLNHLSIGVTDVRAEYERLKGAGVPFPSEPESGSHPGIPVDGFEYVYCEDPWGLIIQFMGPAPGRCPQLDERAT